MAVELESLGLGVFIRSYIFLEPFIRFDFLFLFLFSFLPVFLPGEEAPEVNYFSRVNVIGVSFIFL